MGNVIGIFSAALIGFLLVYIISFAINKLPKTISGMLVILFVVTVIGAIIYGIFFTEPINYPIGPPDDTPQRFVN